MPSASYRRAQLHYARLRRMACEAVVRDALGTGGVRVPLRLAETDEDTLAAWRATWQVPHPAGEGGWNWERILHRAWRRPSAFHLAIWSGEHLCGLAAGRLSKRRLSGVRHTISVHCAESAHSRDHPLRGRVAPLVIASAEAYGGLVGASRIRLIDPLPGVLPIYEALGFEVAYKGAQSVYCERRIRP